MSYINSYAPLADLKGLLGITATTEDVALRKTLERATKEIDSYTGRTFYSVSATKYFDGAGVLWIPDLLSITTSGLQIDEDGNASFESTLASTDYIEYGIGSEDSLNSFPITRLEISENSDYGAFANGIKKGVKITGNWGYGDGTSAPYYLETTLAASISTGATASVNSGTNLSPGMTLLIGTPSASCEQVYIESGSTSLTLERGVNGTSAFAFASGASVYTYKYPEDITQTCLDLASALWQNRARKGITSERLGDYAYTLDKEYIQHILDSAIKSYKKVNI